MKAKLSGAKISYKKMRIIADVVRGKKVTEASAHLKLMPKKGAQIMEKLISSAAANAENNSKQKKEDLVIETVIVNKGPVMKRWRPISRGRAHPYQKKSSNIEITLSPEVSEPKKTKKTSEKKAAKPAEKKTESKKTEEKKAPAKKTEEKKETKATASKKSDK